MATRIEIAQLKEAMPERTMIYVTHDQVEAMTLASRIVVLADKGIAQVGTPLQLYEHPETEFVAQFIGSPQMNLLPGVITATGARTVITLDGGGMAESTVTTTEADRGLRVNIGVRPEDLTVITQGGLFTGTVEIVEALGEVTLLYFAAQPAPPPVIAKLPGTHDGLRHQSVSLTAAPEKVHLFHAGRSLLYR